MNVFSRISGLKRSEDAGEKKPYRRELIAPLLVLAVFLLLRLSNYVDSRLTRDNENGAVVLLQLLIFVFPAVFYLILTKNTLSGLRIRPIGIGHLFIMLSALVSMITASLLLDLTCGGYDSLTGGYDLYGIFVSKPEGGFSDGMYLVLAYALLPSLCEELVFRAILSSEYEKRSSAAAIIMPSLFFAMLHFDPGRFPALFISGVILSLTLYATRSIIAPLAVHFLYNLAAVFGRPFFQTLYDLGGEKMFIFAISALFLLSGFLFCSEAARLYRHYSEKNYSSSYRDMVPPYEKPRDAGSASVSLIFSSKHPRLAATLSSVFSPTALACYIFYAAVILLGN